jgi:transcription elongation factor GreA
MTEPAGSERTERLEQELARAREQRDRLAVELGGEDPEDPDLGDRGDAAVELEELDDLSRMNRRIAEIERLLAGQHVAGAAPGLADGTVVTLRFTDGDVATYRIVAIPEENGDDVVTAGSPLGQALVGRGVGDAISYQGPDGELHAEVVAVRAP